MREIKFKFLMENGEITRAYYLKELIDSDSYINIECEYSSKIKQELQYTGLKDKNDVEIYEGDIVKGNYLRGIGVVEWNKYFCKFDISHRMNISPSDEFEVIGNIYENKDLLES